jgi:hypothetical protein
VIFHVLIPKLAIASLVGISIRGLKLLRNLWTLEYGHLHIYSLLNRITLFIAASSDFHDCPYYIVIVRITGQHPALAFIALAIANIDDIFLLASSMGARVTIGVYTLYMHDTLAEDWEIQ